MTRSEQIKQKLLEISRSNFNAHKLDWTSFSAGYKEGVEWADKHPKPVTISMEEIEEVAKDYITKEWQERQDRLWEMIERNFKAKSIIKTCDWLYEQLNNGNISVDRIPMTELIENYKKIMRL